MPTSEIRRSEAELAAVASIFGQRAHDLKRIVGSFAPLRDQEMLDVEPRRVTVERLRREMSLSEFQRARPSSVAIEETGGPQPG